jgi:hypothetical protein
VRPALHLPAESNEDSNACEALEVPAVGSVALFAKQLQVASRVSASHHHWNEVVELKIGVRPAPNTAAVVAPPDKHLDVVGNWLTLASLPFASARRLRARSGLGAVNPRVLLSFLLIQ